MSIEAARAQVEAEIAERRANAITIKEAYKRINDGEIEPTLCGLAGNFACAFEYKGTKYMLSEAKGHYIRLTDIGRAPSVVVDEISLSEDTNNG